MALHEVGDAGLADFVVPPELGLALDAVRTALENAADTCRYHGDVPPSKPGPFTGSCDSCDQPARVRKALALLRRLGGEQPPVRRYQVDADAIPHQVSGLYPVHGAHGRLVRGLFAPDDAEQAARTIVRELEARGELGPFDVLVTIRGGDDDD